MDTDPSYRSFSVLYRKKKKKIDKKQRMAMFIICYSCLVNSKSIKTKSSFNIKVLLPCTISLKMNALKITAITRIIKCQHLHMKLDKNDIKVINPIKLKFDQRKMDK